MVKNLIWALLFSPVALIAQEKGIAFEHSLSWGDILQKANIEHKYVFVDCYASWCGPCKEMDMKVYTNDSVGKWMNQQFVSVKIQMDRTSHDNAEIQNWYVVAHQLEKDYRIGAYPSFLFFSPDGQAVDKMVGEMDIKGFMAATKSAMDPDQQFYPMLTEYEKGDKNYSQWPKLARRAKRIGEDSLSNVVANDYINNYLVKISGKDRWTKDNISFLNEYGNIIKTGDRIFSRYFKDRQAIDVVMGDSVYADKLINRVIYNDVVKAPVMLCIPNKEEPDWHKMDKIINRKYGAAYSDGNIVVGKVLYYRSTKQWDLYAKFFVIHMKQANIQNWPAGGMVNLVLNNDAFEVFKYSKDKQELEAALSWVEKALAVEGNPNPNELDTKANILYKLGRTDEGIKLEAQSMNLAPQDKEIRIAYEKMKNGLPTWPTQ